MCHLCIQPAEVWYGLADKPVSQTMCMDCILFIFQIILIQQEQYSSQFTEKTGTDGPKKARN